jgi:excisionase family DNA binding protein
MPDLSDYMTTQEAAKALGYHVESIRRLLREGDLQGLKVGTLWLVQRASVTEYIQKNAGLDKFDPRRGNQ